jgi:hypothetical protein
MPCVTSKPSIEAFTGESSKARRKEIYNSPNVNHRIAPELDIQDLIS